MLPVHLAAAANSLPALRWLAEGEGCSLVGTGAMTVGRPPKSVFQVTPSLSAADCTLIALSDCILDDAQPCASFGAPAGPRGTGRVALDLIAIDCD